MKAYRLRFFVAVLSAAFSVASLGASEWRVKSYQGSLSRNSVSESVAVGALCGDAVIWRSATGKTSYHAVAITRDGLTVNLPVECELVTAPDPTPAPAPASPIGTQTLDSVATNKRVDIAYTDPIDGRERNYAIVGTSIEFVTPNGCGNGCDGSAAKPIAASQVISRCAPGKLFVFRAGTYGGNYGGNWGSRNFALGASCKGIALAAMPGEVATLISPDPTQHGNIIAYDGGGYADGLTIAGFTMQGGGECIFGGGYGQIVNGVMQKGAANLAIIGNTLSARYTGNSMTGLVSVQGDGAKIIGNVFQDAGWSALYNNNHATYVQSGASNVLIEANLYRHLQLGHVIQVHQDGIAQKYTNVVIRRNKIVNTDPMATRGATVSNVTDDSTVVIEENVFDTLGQKFSATSIYGGTVTLKNNTYNNILGGTVGKIWLSSQYGHVPTLYRKGNTITGGSGPDYGVDGVPAGNIIDLP